MKPIVLIGGGGHAQSVMAMLENREAIAGYTAPEPSEGIGMQYLGTDEDALANIRPEDADIHICVGFTAGCSLALRRRIADRMEIYRQRTLIAPSAWVAPGTSIGDGCAIMARATVNHCEIGGMCIVNTGAIIEHGCRLEENVFIGPGAILCGEVTVGADSFIGAGATIRQGVTIASGTVVGMGATVTESITDPGTYIGCPAKKIER